MVRHTDAVMGKWGESMNKRNKCKDCGRPVMRILCHACKEARKEKKGAEKKKVI